MNRSSLDSLIGNTVGFTQSTTKLSGAQTAWGLMKKMIGTYIYLTAFHRRDTCIGGFLIMFESLEWYR